MSFITVFIRFSLALAWSVGMVPLVAGASTADEPQVLRGPWLLFRGELLGPAEAAERANSDSSAQLVNAPQRWTKDGAADPFGVATYFLALPAQPGITQGFLVPNQDTAYQLWFDGQLVASDGQVSSQASQALPSRRTTLVFWTPTRDFTEITLQVSNYHHYKGGMVNAIRVGSPQQVLALRQGTLMVTFFLAGSYAAVGLYHLFLYLYRRKDQLNLWFGLICFLFVLRTFFIGDADIALFFPAISWAGITRSGFLLESAFLPLFALYTRQLFDGLLPKPVQRAVLWFSLLYSLVVLVAPLDFFGTWIHPYYDIPLFGVTGLIVLRIGWFWKQRQPAAGAFFWSFLLIFVLMLDPALLSVLWPGLLFESTTLGFFLFLISQAVTLGRRVAQAHNRLDSFAASLEDQVRERTERLAQTNKALRERNQERDFFLMSLSHEVRTPMTIILNYIARIADRHPSDRELVSVRQNLEKIFSNMVNIFDMLRKERGLQLFEHDQIIDVSQEAAAQIDFYLPYAQERGITLECHIEANLWARIHRSALDRIIGNYLENALRYNASGGLVRLELQRRAAQLVITVSNSGPRLQPEEIDRLFLPFSRLSSQPGGTGLGLYLVSELAREAGGSVRAESQDCAGGTEQQLDGWNSFELILEACQPVQDQTSARPAGAVPPSGLLSESTAPATLDDRLVLIVEDEPDLRAILVDSLHSQFMVKTAQNGQQALDLIGQGLRPDLIVSDVMMPGIDGVALYAALAEIPALAATPVLFATAMANAPEKIAAISGRRLDFIFKPFTAEALASRINQLLHTTSAEEAL